MSGFDWHQLVYLLSTACWVVLGLVLACAALYRFRATPSGILIGGSFALMSAKNLLRVLVWELVLEPMSEAASGLSAAAQDAHLVKEQLFYLGTTGVSFVLILALAVGIFLIPLSLGRLDTGQRAPLREEG